MVQDAIMNFFNSLDPEDTKYYSNQFLDNLIGGNSIRRATNKLFSYGLLECCEIVNANSSTEKAYRLPKHETNIRVKKPRTAYLKRKRTYEEDTIY